MAWPKAKNEGLRTLKDLCLKQEVKRAGQLVGFKVPHTTFLSLKSEAVGLLRMGGVPTWSEGRVIKDMTILVNHNNNSILDAEEKKVIVFTGGNSMSMDRMIERLLCIIGS